MIILLECKVLFGSFKGFCGVIGLLSSFKYYSMNFAILLMPCG